ncbi:MAG TPA: SwmB domain-containing protein [Bacteroidales bacterium]|nr:SwmB domain-containing protein [Bacteroidales bacterium]
MLLFLLYSITTKAATYYVATTGNDSNPGTINAPWLTWGKAAFTAVAGDTVYFRGGTYRGDRNYLMKPNSGTASNYICFFNYPGEIPILDFNSYSPGSWEYVIRPYNGDNYLHFKGLTVKNFQQKPTSGYIAGIEANGCHHLIFENLRFENIGGPCMGAYGSTEVYFINCDAIGSIDSLATTPGGNGSGFAINTRVDLFDESMYDSRVYFTGCRAWGNGDQGFAMSGQGIVEMTNCWSFDNGRMSGEGYGAKIGFGSTTDVNSLRIIKNCIFAINAYNGLTTNNVGGTPFNVQFYNNFLYRNGYKPTPTDYQYTGAGIWIASGSDEDVPNDMWANNISYANEKGAVVDHGGNYYTHEYNAWDYPGGITVTDDDFISLDTLQLWYPRKSDGSLPDITFGKLAPSSDLIDAGTPSIKTRDYNITLSCNGDAPDLGWFESPGTSSSPTQDIPVYISSVIQNATPLRLEMTYNLTLANIVPATTAFSVKVNNVSRSVSAVAISGTKVMLTLASPVIYGDVITVAYTKPASNPIQTAAGGQAASITAQNVTNNVAAIIPDYVSSVIQDASPARLEMTYNLTLANIVPSSAAFTVKVNNVTRSVSAVAISGTKVLLTLVSPVIYGDAVTIAYTKPASNPIQTAAGGQAESITTQSVTNNVAAVIPAYVSSVIQNATPARLEITYNLSLASIVPSASAFAVKVNNVSRNVSSVTISGTKVLLTLASPVIYGDVVTVAYTKPASNFIQTTSGGVAASITAQNVTNNVAAINNQPPIVSISSPTKSTGFVAPAAITIDANASDPDGSVTKVEFYNGTSKLGETTSAPYSYTWKEVSAGTYSITASATDNKGLKTVSTAVTVVVEKSATVVNQLPSVSIKIPNEKRPKKHDNVVIIAEASDPDGNISKVELKSGNVTIAEMTTAPYVFTLQNVDTGNYVLTATATDNLGAVSISDALELRVEDLYNPDLISLYPNPNYGFFRIDILEELPDQECKLSIIGMTGTIVYQENLTPGETSKDIRLRDLQSGPYVLMVTNGKTILTTKKFIKQ